MNVLASLKIREKLLLGFGLIGLIFVASSLYTLNQISTSNETSRSIAEHNAPAWDAIMEIKVELIAGHLWIEEAMSGDNSIPKDKIFIALFGPTPDTDKSNVKNSSF